MIDSREIPRRSFLSAALVAGGSAAALGCRTHLRSSNPARVTARREAAWRKRALILDDDGDLVYADAAREGPDAFLRLRMQDAAAVGIDSIAWCMMWGIAKKGQTEVRYWQNQKQGVPFQENMPDPSTVVADFGRERDIEIFGSLRMNDCHDAFGLPFPKLVYPLKVEHPELLIGHERQRGKPSDGLSAASWSGLNFAHKRVRDDRLWWIAHTAQSYGFAGVDLNFFRMPFYFRLGEEEAGAPLMTEMVREARRRLDVVGRRRGRAVLLGARVPGTLEACHRIGIDLETWLREGLVDRLLTGGGYVCYSTPAEELIRLGHRYDVPVYPCINCPANYDLGGGNLRAAASNLWWAGADGIYLWNFHYIDAPGKLGYGQPSSQLYRDVLTEISAPQNLRRLDKTFAVNRSVWEQYQRASARAPLPQRLGTGAGDAAVIPVRVGDDVRAALAGDYLRDVNLRVQASGATRGDRMTILFNDWSHDTEFQREDGWLALPIEPKTVKQGVNEVTVVIAKRTSTARRPITIENAHVHVRYLS